MGSEGPNPNQVDDMPKVDELDHGIAAKVSHLAQFVQLMLANPRFRHTPMNDPNTEIRLIRFDQMLSGGILEVHLDTFSIRELPKYTAITYV